MKYGESIQKMKEEQIFMLSGSEGCFKTYKVLTKRQRLISKYIKFKNIYLSKDTIREVKIDIQNGKRYQRHPIRGQVLRKCNGILQFSEKENDSGAEQRGHMDLTGTLQKRKSKCLINIGKAAQSYS